MQAVCSKYIGGTWYSFVLRKHRYIHDNRYKEQYKWNTDAKQREEGQKEGYALTAAQARAAAY